MYKIIGGASNSGHNMDYIIDLADKIKENMGTLNISMTSNSPAGEALKNSGGFKEVEIGRGIEGEEPRDTFNWLECDNLFPMII